MNVRCTRCGAVNGIPPAARNVLFTCYNCGAYLPVQTPTTGTSEAVGLIGGAALGAAIGGPAGAILGAIIGTLIGQNAKTNG